VRTAMVQLYLARSVASAPITVLREYIERQHPIWHAHAAPPFATAMTVGVQLVSSVAWSRD
jgi:hypothetical protein